MIQDSKIKKKIMADKRGKISTGRRNDKGLPETLDFFNCSAFPELERVYGLEPKQLLLFFPGDHMEDFFNNKFALYGKNNVMKRICDGNTCEHRLEERVEGAFYGQGEVSACICTSDIPLRVPHKTQSDKTVRNPVLCSYNRMFTAYVLDPVSGKPLTINPIIFTAGSQRHPADGIFDNIYTELTRYKRFLGVPFKLWVEMAKGVDKVFPQWFITPYLPYEQHFIYLLDGVQNEFVALPDGLNTSLQAGPTLSAPMVQKGDGEKLQTEMSVPAKELRAEQEKRSETMKLDLLTAKNLVTLKERWDNYQPELKSFPDDIIKAVTVAKDTKKSRLEEAEKKIEKDDDLPF